MELPNEMSDHNRFEQQYAYQLILSYFEVFVQHLIVYRDQLCQMGFKPKYGLRAISFPLTCTILL